MLLAIIGFTACDSDSIEGLKGEFSDITFCNFNSGNVLPTEKIGKGIKALNVQLADATGNNLSLRFGSKEWILGEGTLENFANYMKTFGGHTVTAMVGMSFQKSTSNNVNGSLTANGEDALKKNDPLFYYLNYANASATKGVSGETNESTKYSYFGRLSYDFMGRYLLQASLRAAFPQC